MLFFINGISFLISSLSECFIRYPYVKKKIVREKRQSLFWEGLKEIRSNKFLLFAAIIGGGLINLFLAPLSLYIPVYVRDYMRQSSLHFGLLTSIIPIGGIICSVVILKKNMKINMAELVVTGFILQGIALVLFGLSYELFYAYTALFVLGISFTLTSIGMQTVIQRTIPEECLGRSISSIIMIASISVPMGYLFGGLLLEYMPLNVILRVSGLIISIIGGYSYFILKDTIDFKIDHDIEKQG
ncbi:MAG: MFS transporter, partial [Lutispora sp.]